MSKILDMRNDKTYMMCILYYLIEEKTMSYQEKSNIVSLFCAVIIFALYFYFVRQNYQAGLYEGAQVGPQIGKSILWLMLGGTVLNIVAHIAFSIIYAIIKREANPSFVVDERDKLIELRALRFAYYTFGAGFVISMIALTLGQTVFVAFNIIILSIGLATFIEGIVQIYLYRRGF